MNDDHDDGPGILGGTFYIATMLSPIATFGSYAYTGACNAMDIPVGPTAVATNIGSPLVGAAGAATFTGNSPVNPCYSEGRAYDVKIMLKEHTKTAICGYVIGAAVGVAAKTIFK